MIVACEALQPPVASQPDRAPHATCLGVKVSCQDPDKLSGASLTTVALIARGSAYEFLWTISATARAVFVGSCDQARNMMISLAGKAGTNDALGLMNDSTVDARMQRGSSC